MDTPTTRPVLRTSDREAVNTAIIPHFLPHLGHNASGMAEHCAALATDALLAPGPDAVEEVREETLAQLEAALGTRPLTWTDALAMVRQMGGDVWKQDLPKGADREAVMAMLARPKPLDTFETSKKEGCRVQLAAAIGKHPDETWEGLLGEARDAMVARTLLLAAHREGASVVAVYEAWLTYSTVDAARLATLTTDPNLVLLRQLLDNPHAGWDDMTAFLTETAAVHGSRGALKIGDTVLLKSGGPLMTVTDILDRSGVRFIVSRWFDDGQVFQSEDPEACLRRTTEHDAMPAPGKTTPCWAKVEKMGHRTLWGYVEEVLEGGARMFRVTSPALPATEPGPFIQGEAAYYDATEEQVDLFTPASLYGLRPMPRDAVLKELGRARPTRWKHEEQPSASDMGPRSIYKGQTWKGWRDTATGRVCEVLPEGEDLDAWELACWLTEGGILTVNDGGGGIVIDHAGVSRVSAHILTLAAFKRGGVIVPEGAPMEEGPVDRQLPGTPTWKEVVEAVVLEATGLSVADFEQLVNLHRRVDEEMVNRRFLSLSTVEEVRAAYEWLTGDQQATRPHSIGMWVQDLPF